MDKAYYALCLYCGTEMNYGHMGLTSLTRHAQRSKEHLAAVQCLKDKTQTSITSTFTDDYGLEEGDRVTNLTDRTSSIECRLLCFAAEHNLPATTISALIPIMQEASSDPVALSNVKLSTYSFRSKLVDGVTDDFTDILSQNMRTTAHSVNVDKARNKNSPMKILSILVFYFSIEQKKTAVYHLR